MCPQTTEFDGFYTKLVHEHALSPTPATTALYTPLIDMDPTDQDTMMTAMCEVLKKLKLKGWLLNVNRNANQQLYRVMVNVTWVYPELFLNFIPRFGGMHMLMSFVGRVWTFIANSG